MRACPTHAPTFAHPRVRVSVRVRLGAHVSALKRLSPFHRRGRLRAARLAGVQRRVGVQRRHRRVEHRARQRLDRGMRRFSAGDARPFFDAARPLWPRVPVRARACVRV